MKTQLIMLDTPIIVSEEKLKDEEPCLVDGGLGRIGVDEFYSNVKYSVKPKKIIAGIEGLPSIDWNGLEEEFGWVDVEKMANELIRNKYPYPNYKDLGYWKDLYKEGFKKAQSLNEKKFSLEDMRAAFEKGALYGTTKTGNNHYFNQVIGSLQQPKVFDIEVEMEEKHFRIVKDVNGIPYDHEYTLELKITNNSIKIINSGTK